MVFLSEKVDGNIFTSYWKVLVLTIWTMGNTVFFEPKRWWKDDIYWSLKSSCFDHFGNRKHGRFWAKKMMERWYLLITENFFFSPVRQWKIRSFLSQKDDGKMIFTDYWKVLVLNVSVMGNTVFFQPKIWWKGDISLVFFSFPWYSRTWQIWFFAEWFC